MGLPSFPGLIPSPQNTRWSAKRVGSRSNTLGVSRHQHRLSPGDRNIRWGGCGRGGRIKLRAKGRLCQIFTLFELGAGSSKRDGLPVIYKCQGNGLVRMNLPLGGCVEGKKLKPPVEVIPTSNHLLLAFCAGFKKMPQLPRDTVTDSSRTTCLSEDVGIREAPGLSFPLAMDSPGGQEPTGFL